MKFSMIFLFLICFYANGQAHLFDQQPSVSPVMVKASLIARQSSLPQSTGRCWRFVKKALVASGAVSSYPKTNLACEAGRELVEVYGFTKLHVSSPWNAPVGSVLVYAANEKYRAGHVEIRGSNDFISDYRCHRPPSFKFLGAYALVNT